MKLERRGERDLKKRETNSERGRRGEESINEREKREIMKSVRKGLL